MTGPAYDLMPGGKTVCTGSDCNAVVYYLKHVGTGKVAPITAQLFPDGNITVDLERGTYSVVPKIDRPDYKAGLHKNHFADCPNAPRFKRRG